MKRYYCPDSSHSTIRVHLLTLVYDANRRYINEWRPNPKFEYGCVLYSTTGHVVAEVNFESDLFDWIINGIWVEDDNPYYGLSTTVVDAKFQAIKALKTYGYEPIEPKLASMI